MIYKEAAKRIIKEHLKTAVFIDENAREVFSTSGIPELFEEKLSVELYEEFSKHSILLSTYKYSKLSYEHRKNCLLNGRNLVLLDWKLDGDNGEDDALKIVSDIIYARPKILFCGIYTKERPEIVFKNVLSYFSGVSNQECDDIKSELMLEEEDGFREFRSRLEDVVLSNSDKEIKEFRSLYASVFERGFFQNDEDFYKKLVECWCAYSNYQKSNSKQIRVASHKISDNVLLIGNTFVVILNKTTTKFIKLLSSFTRIIADYSNGFSLLMSLEMNNIIHNKTLTIDSRINNISRELFAYHKMQDKAGFEIFIKEAMLNGLSLGLMDEQLSTIQSLQKTPSTYKPRTDELLKMNVFYNSTERCSNTKLMFGDVFKCNDNSFYYICITPLCDCANPKNENTFYFAKGQVVENKTIEKELKRSEEVFVSYLPGNVMVRWADSSDKGKPVYITPIPLTVPKPSINNNCLNAFRLKAKISQKEKLEFEYITTLKQNYAQRIANHAFAHSIRVGISFFPNK